MKKEKFVKFSLLLSSLLMLGVLMGCVGEKDADIQSGAANSSYENEELNLYISHTTECLREDEPELYEAMQTLLEERTETQFMLASPDIDLNSEEIIETETGMVYYPLKDSTLTAEGLRNQLLEVYETNYVDKVLLPYYFEKSKCYMEQEGQLYGQDVAAVISTLKEDWTIWQVNDNYYYLQGYEDVDVDTIVILTVVRQADSLDFLISDEVEINLQ